MECSYVVHCEGTLPSLKPLNVTQVALELLYLGAYSPSGFCLSVILAHRNLEPCRYLEPREYLTSGHPKAPYCHYAE